MAINLDVLSTEDLKKLSEGNFDGISDTGLKYLAGIERTTGEVAARGFERGITSLIGGMRQIAGDSGPGAASVFEVPVEGQEELFAEEKLKFEEAEKEKEKLRQYEARVGREESPWTAYSTEIVGNIVGDPTNLVAFGAKGIIKGALMLGGIGAATGGLERVDEEVGDSRLTNVAIGGALGGVIGGVAGGLAKRADDIAKAAIEPSDAPVPTPKTREEIEAELPALTPNDNLPTLLAKAPEADQKYVNDVLSRYEEDDVVPYSAFKEMSEKVEDTKLAALFRGASEPPPQEAKFVVGDAEQAAKAVPSDTPAPVRDVGGFPFEATEEFRKAEVTGDYRGFLKESAVRTADLPESVFKKMFDTANPNSGKNLKSFLTKNVEGEETLKEVLESLKARNIYERGGIKGKQSIEEAIQESLSIPEQVAFNAVVNRKVQEQLPLPVLLRAAKAAGQAIQDLDKLKELYKVAKAMNSEDAYAVLQKEIAELGGFLNSLEGSISNTARTLAMTRQIKNQILSGNKLPEFVAKSKEDVDDFFQALEALPTSGLTPEEAINVKAKTVSKILKQPKWTDKVAEYVVNSYISALGTPAVNLLSSIAKATTLIPERAIEAILTKGTKRLSKKDQVYIREAAEMARGVVEGVAEAMQLIRSGFLKGYSLDADPTSDYIIKSIGGQKGATRTEQIAGEVIRVPTRVGVAVDELSKAVFRRMQLNALAYRTSRNIPENQLGGLSRDEFYNRLRQVDIGEVNPENLKPLWKDELRKVGGEMSSDIINDIEKFAITNTFQKELGKYGNAIMSLRKEYPLFTLIMPFIKTPINIFKDALTYTPASFFMKSGGGTPESKIARIMMGTGLAYMVYQQVMSDNITGSYPTDPAKRNAMIAAGIPEYSMKIGDQWYSYSRIEPLASVFGVATDFMNMLPKYIGPNAKPWDGFDKALIDFSLTITKNLTSKTFLEGITSALQALHDPQRYGAEFLSGYANAVVPGAVAQVARITDPVQRQVDGFFDGIANRIPGLRQDLPVKYDILGKERQERGSTIQGALGIATQPTRQTVLQETIEKTNFSFSPPDRKLGGVRLSNEDYSMLSKLSGDRVSARLTNLVNNPNFKELPAPRQKYLMEKFASKERREASEIMLRQKLKDPAFRLEYRQRKAAKKGLELED